MTRRLAFLIVLLVGSGCAMVDEFPADHMNYSAWPSSDGSGAPSSCYRPSCAETTAQTAEPELLRPK